MEPVLLRNNSREDQGGFLRHAAFSQESLKADYFHEENCKFSLS